MSRKWWATLIAVAVVIGVFAAIKLMPLYATLVAVGTYVFGCFSGYILKKKEIIEKIVEKPVEVIKEVVKKVEVPVEKVVEKVVYVPTDPTVNPEVEQPKAEVPVEVAKADLEVPAKSRRRRKSINKKVAE